MCNCDKISKLEHLELRHECHLKAVVYPNLFINDYE